MTIKTAKPHLVILLTQDLQSPSGLGRYFPLAKYLVREGYQVTILAMHPDFENLKEDRFEQEGVRVKYVAQMHVRKIGNQTLYYSQIQLAKLSMKAMISLYQEGMKENPKLLEKISQNARQAFIDHYSIAALGNTYRKHLETFP